MRDTTHPPRLRQRARPPVQALAGDVVLGVIAALGLAPFGIWPATLLALTIAFWRMARAPRAATAFWHAMALGVGWFGMGLSWIVEPFLVEPEIYGWMAPFALILMALGGGLFWAIPAALAHRAAADWRMRAAAIAGALILSDWLRGWIFTGFPWALTGHVFIDTPMAQAASVAGAAGLSAIALSLAALPTLLWRPFSRPAAGFAAGALLAVILTGALWAAGLARLAAPLPADRDITLRLVQPNAEQRLKWHPDWSGIFYQRLLDLSAAPGNPDLVIWPETAVNFLLDDPAADQVLPAMAGAGRAPLILGIQRRDGMRYYNSLAVLDRDGGIRATYDKFHLVPFGEYIPWGDALARIGIHAFAAQQGNGYSPGPGPQIMSIPGVPDFQPLICYEAIFPQHIRALPDRPGWLLQITNDAWFGQFSGPYQHLAQARLRAVQSGLPLVRAANTGVSAVIDARGSMRDTLPLNSAGFIDAALPGALPETPWVRWGDWPAIIFAIGLIGAGALRRRG